MNEQYSGRTTCYEHKRDDWEEHGKGKGHEAISTMKVFNAQWTNCPVEIEDIVRALWKHMGYGNDYYYYSGSPENLREIKTLPSEKWNSSKSEWDRSEVDLNTLADYLVKGGVKEDETILIHWWW